MMSKKLKTLAANFGCPVWDFINSTNDGNVSAKLHWSDFKNSIAFLLRSIFFKCCRDSSDLILS